VGAVDGGSVNAFLAAALTRVMRATVPIPALASASVINILKFKKKKSVLSADRDRRRAF
jgi:hypothetical protein